MHIGKFQLLTAPSSEKGFLIGFPTAQSLEGSLVRDVKDSTHFREASSNAIDRNHSIRRCVLLLFRFFQPTAILRAIISIFVKAFNCMVFARAFTHVCSKLRVIQPAFIHLYAAATVAMVVVQFGISATPTHRAPNTVGLFELLPSSRGTVGRSFLFVANTAILHSPIAFPVEQIGARFHSLSPAITSAEHSFIRIAFFVDERFSDGDANELAESLPYEGLLVDHFSNLSADLISDGGRRQPALVASNPTDFSLVESTTSRAASKGRSRAGAGWLGLSPFFSPEAYARG